MSIMRSFLYVINQIFSPNRWKIEGNTWHYHHMTWLVKENLFQEVITIFCNLNVKKHHFFVKIAHFLTYCLLSYSVITFVQIFWLTQLIHINNCALQPILFDLNNLKWSKMAKNTNFHWKIPHFELPRTPRIDKIFTSCLKL